MDQLFEKQWGLLRGRITIGVEWDLRYPGLSAGVGWTPGPTYLTERGGVLGAHLRVLPATLVVDVAIGKRREGRAA